MKEKRDQSSTINPYDLNEVNRSLKISVHENGLVNKSASRNAKPKFFRYREKK